MTRFRRPGRRHGIRAQTYSGFHLIPPRMVIVMRAVATLTISQNAMTAQTLRARSPIPAETGPRIVNSVVPSFPLLRRLFPVGVRVVGAVKNFSGHIDRPHENRSDERHSDERHHRHQSDGATCQFGVSGSGQFCSSETALGDARRRSLADLRCARR